MGKETGFLEIERQDRSYADPQERLQHYREFVVPHSEDGLQKAATGETSLEEILRAVG